MPRGVQLTVMVVGESGAGRSSVVHACLGRTVVRGSSHATVRYTQGYINREESNELQYSKVPHVRDYR
jgi:septin family protein